MYSMEKSTPIFIFNSLNVMRGGLTKAVIERANTLAEKYNEVTFLTLKYQQNFSYIKEQLYKTNTLDERVKVVNLFDDIADFQTKKLKSKKREFKVKEKGLIEFKDDKNELPSYRYYENGLYRKYKRFDKNNNLLFIDYMNENRERYRRDEYNYQGFLVRSRHISSKTNNPVYDQYFDKNGSCFLSIWVNKDKKEYRTLYFKDSPKEFDDPYELYTEWVEKKVNSYKNPFVMSDSRFTDKLVLDLKLKHGKKVAVLHNNHFKKPYDGTNGIKSTWETFIENYHKFDNIVFLTEEQKRDIEKITGEHKKSFVIPHAAKKVNLNNKDYDPYLAVTLARYDSQKRLDESINAFSYVVKEIPEAKYHIYGFGDLKDDLAKQIKELGLEKNIKLKGFSNNPQETYQSAACSILTSDYEGFGMVITESLATGTPVISYDIKYGPKDIIRNNIDGYIVKKGDQKELASKIINVMKDKELRKRLSQNAPQVLERFSFENYKNKWFSLLN